jgi:threonine dehydratase
MAGADIYLKCENLQKTGSFKVRGAYNKIARMTESGPLPHLVAASAGNHAQGVAYAAEVVGAKATIVMPRSAPLAKVSATEGYGPEIVLHGSGYDEAYEKARAICDEQGATFVHAYEDEDVIAGQGTIGLEILSSMPTADAIIVPAGGGGLLAGIAACVKQVNPRIKVFGVQADGADAIVRSFREKRHVATETAATIADGIAVRNPGEITTGIIREYADDMVTVSDAELAEAILLLLERTKLVVEPSGAAAVAAVINRKLPELAGKRVVCVLSGGNIDVSIIHEVVEQGLISRGRLKRH